MANLCLAVAKAIAAAKWAGYISLCEAAVSGSPPSACVTVSALGVEANPEERRAFCGTWRQAPQLEAASTMLGAFGEVMDASRREAQGSALDGLRAVRAVIIDSGRVAPRTNGALAGEQTIEIPPSLTRTSALHEIGHALFGATDRTSLVRDPGRVPSALEESLCDHFAVGVREGLLPGKSGALSRASWIVDVDPPGTDPVHERQLNDPACVERACETPGFATVEQAVLAKSGDVYQYSGVPSHTIYRVLQESGRIGLDFRKVEEWIFDLAAGRLEGLPRGGAAVPWRWQTTELCDALIRSLPTLGKAVRSGCDLGSTMGSSPANFESAEMLPEYRWGDKERGSVYGFRVYNVGGEAGDVSARVTKSKCSGVFVVSPDRVSIPADKHVDFALGLGDVDGRGGCRAEVKVEYEYGRVLVARAALVFDAGTGSDCLLTEPKTLYFPLNGWRVGDADPLLAQRQQAIRELLGDQARQPPGCVPDTLTVEGHADDLGVRSYNYWLSYLRRSEVLGVLLKEPSLAGVRFVGRDYGPDSPPVPPCAGQGPCEEDRRVVVSLSWRWVGSGHDARAGGE